MPPSASVRTVVVVAVVVVAGLVTTLYLYSAFAPGHGSSNSQNPAGSGGGGAGRHYAVEATISQINVSGVSVGFWPQYVIYDPQNGMLYVASEFSKTVSIVDPSPFHVEHVIQTGADARGLVLDPANGLLFVSNDYASNVTVINTTTNTVVSTLDYYPYGYMVGEQLDPATGQLLLLANNPPDSILAINISTYSVTRVLPIAENPGGGNGLAINETTHVIYFPARGELSVAEIGELNGTTFANVSMPGSEGPTSTFFDPLNGYIYVMLGGWLSMGPGNQTVVLNPATDEIVTTLNVGTWPDAYAYNATSEILYVSCAASGNLSLINASTDKVAGSIFLGNGTLPGVVAIDPVTGNLYIGEDGPGSLVEVGLVGGSATALVPAASYNAPASTLVAARWAPTTHSAEL